MLDTTLTTYDSYIIHFITALVELVSGGVGGACATVAVYPFDLLRTRLGTQAHTKVTQ